VWDAELTIRLPHSNEPTDCGRRLERQCRVRVVNRAAARGRVRACFAGSLLIARGDHTRRVNNWTPWLPAFARFRQSPEFPARMQSTGILEYWQQAGFPPHCRQTAPGTVACD
jgi:hypothetical protein